MSFSKRISDNDKREPLPPGTIIVDTNGIRYTIKDAKVGVGGSALIYPVERVGTIRNLIIKECYPYSDIDCFYRNEKKNSLCQ